MAWIESHTVLLRHRKLVELARELRIRRSYTMGHLHSLWHTALEQQEDGDLTSWTDDMIAEASDFPGDAPQWVRLLQKHGWLNRRVLHDWLDYAGRYLDAKYRRNNPDRLEEILKKHVKPGFSLAKAGPPYRTLPDLTEPTTTAVNGVSRENNIAPDLGITPKLGITQGITPKTETKKAGNNNDGNGPVESPPKGVKTAAQLMRTTMAPAEFLEQKRLLELVWSIGEHRGKRVIDLPAEYCAWALGGGLSRLGDEYKRALRARLEAKAQEKMR